MTQPWFRVRSLQALGSALSEIRQAAGLSQSDAAESTHTSRPTVSRMERGQQVSTATVIDMVAVTGYDIVLVPRGARLKVEQEAK